MNKLHYRQKPNLDNHTSIPGRERISVLVGKQNGTKDRKKEGGYEGLSIDWKQYQREYVHSAQGNAYRKAQSTGELAVQRT